MPGPQWMKDRLAGLPFGWPRSEAVASIEEWLREAAERRRRDREERRRQEALPPRAVIYMVHGTFACRAKWIRPRSPISESLRRSLDWRIKVWPVHWSGGNMVGARWRAALRLRQKIERGVKAYPDAKHFVIAHSHGGNVALSALSDEDVSKKVSGVITLATPFLSAKVVKPRELIDFGVGLFAALFAGWCVILAGVAQGHGWAWWLPALLTCLVVLGLLWLGGWLNDQMHDFAKRLVARMPSVLPPPDKLAVVRVEGDEAIATLAGARFAGSSVRLFWRFLTAPAFRWMADLLEAVDYGGLHAIQEKLREQILKSQTPSTFPRTAPGAPDLFTPPPQYLPPQPSPWEEAWQNAKPLLWQLIPVVAVESYKVLSPGWRLVLLCLVGLYGVPAAIALLLVVLSVPVGILTSVTLFPCGWAVPLAGPYLQLAAEPTPTGRSSVFQFPGGGGDKGLDHSYAYQNERVWDFAADWIAERLKPEKEGNQGPSESTSPPEDG